MLLPEGVIFQIEGGGSSCKHLRYLKSEETSFFVSKWRGEEMIGEEVREVGMDLVRPPIS